MENAEGQGVTVSRKAEGGDGDEQQGFAGMPRGTRVSAGGALPTMFGRGGVGFTAEALQGERDFTEYSLSKRLLPRSVQKNPPPLDFAIIELRPDEEERAIANAGSGIKLQQSFTEMVKASVYAIGGKRADYDTKESWWRSIGPKCRKQVERCFNEHNGIDDAAGEEILATARPGRG